LNFLVDAQLPPALALWIAERGHTAQHVLEVNLATVTDSALWEHARKNGSVIVSKDEDFVDRWIMSAEPVPLIWIRKGNCSNRALVAWIEPLWLDAVGRLQRGEKLIELLA
jgi:predicted nuclease of predicted toxin-antitoxin system